MCRSFSILILARDIALKLVQNSAVAGNIQNIFLQRQQNHSFIQFLTMAQQISVNVYQINSQDPVPLANVSKMGFPPAGILLRVANDQNGNPGALLSNGVRCYGNIQALATGSQYLVLETEAQLVTLSNA